MGRRAWCLWWSRRCSCSAREAATWNWVKIPARCRRCTRVLFMFCYARVYLLARSLTLQLFDEMRLVHLLPQWMAFAAIERQPRVLLFAQQPAREDDKNNWMPWWFLRNFLTPQWPFGHSKMQSFQICYYFSTFKGGGWISLNNSQWLKIAFSRTMTMT